MPEKLIKLDARRLLTSYMWPGNIRELRNVIERLIILCEKEISVKDLKIHTNMRNTIKP